MFKVSIREYFDFLNLPAAEHHVIAAAADLKTKS